MTTRRVARAGRISTVITVLLASGCATTVTGVVYADKNGNNVRDNGEPAIPGAVVALDRGTFAVTDANGHFRIDGATPGSYVWVTVPDGYRPGPVYAPADGTPTSLGVMPLTDREAQAPLTFVVASDSHTTEDTTEDTTTAWDGGDLAAAVAQATSLPDPPRFFTILGDITQGGADAEYQRVDAALADLDTAWVPVAGNHDWYDGGGTYRHDMGPDNYSFDVGGLHVVVWDTNLDGDDQVAFFAADLAHVSPGTTVIALGHIPPDDDVAQRIADLGVDYMFTGHWHANRRVAHGTMTEWGTQTFVMGGIDESPAGYRVVTFADPHAPPQIVARDRLNAPHLGLVWPHAGSCVPADSWTLVAAAAIDASEPAVTARIDCGDAVPLASAGGWDFRATVSALAPGRHTIELTATAAGGKTLTTDTAFDVCDGGGEWATPVGGTLSLAPPVVAGNVVLVAQIDRGAGDGGGVTALDLATGEVRWKHTTAFPVANAPAVDGDTVVVALSNGELHAIALADGAPRWTANVADGLSSLASTQWAAPAIANGLVYAGVPGRFAAFDLETGERRWAQERSPDYPWLGSRAAPVVAGGAVFAAFDRTSGLKAFDAATGAPAWTATSPIAINGTPVVDGGVVFAADAQGDASGFDAATGRARWSKNLTPDGFDWGYSITAAPAAADGRLFVATQWSDLVALDEGTGAELWRVQTPVGPLETAHYRSAQAGFAAGPVVANGTVWIGRPDGVLESLDPATGDHVWSTQLGAPIVSAPAAAGSGVIVAGYDGAVRRIEPGEEREPASASACPALAVGAEAPATGDDEAAQAGGCDAARSSSAMSSFFIFIMAVITRWAFARSRSAR